MSFTKSLVQPDFKIIPVKIPIFYTFLSKHLPLILIHFTF